MAIDSVASLLFNIGANSDDAEENITRFRALLGTDLDAMGDQFSDWAEETFGKIETVKGALIGLTAGIAAVTVAAAAMSNEAGDHFREYAEAIDNASQKTGISVENMSKLHFVADEVGINFDTLVMGIVRLAHSMFTAAQGSNEQSAAFKLLGITQKDLADGQKDLMGLVEKIADRYSKMADGAGKAAISQELLSRGGSELIRFLNLGSEGIKEFSKHAEELGVVLNDKDVQAARELTAGIKLMHSEQEAMDKYIAEQTLPLWIKWKALEVGFVNAVRDSAAGAGLQDFFTNLAADYEMAGSQIQKTMELVTKHTDAGGGIIPGMGGPKVKEAARDFNALSSELDAMRLRLAEMQGPSEKLSAELEQMRDRTQKMAADLIAAHNSGKITEETWEREANALLQLRMAIGTWGEAVRKQLEGKDLEELQKFVDKADEVGRQIQEKIDAMSSDDSWSGKRNKWESEVANMRQRFEQEGTLTLENQTLLALLEELGLAKIADEQDSAYAAEVIKLREHTDKLTEMEMTKYQKLAAEYARDAQQFSQAEEEKQLAAAGSEEKRLALSAQFAALRKQLDQQYQNDLQALMNSEGWQGVFGSHFAQLIKQDEQLSKEWQTSSNQSMMLVQVAMESMGEMGQHAFEGMAQGMAGAIAHAVVYGGSIGKAMREATAAVLEGIAAQSATEAIYALAWGFIDLAQGNFAAADAAFEAAALFGAVAVAAGAGGRLVSGGSSSGGSGGGGGRGGSGGGASGRAEGTGFGSDASPGASATAGGVTVHVAGHVIGASGIEQLASMINDAVQNRDVRLVATQTRQATLATF